MAAGQAAVPSSGAPHAYGAVLRVTGDHEIGERDLARLSVRAQVLEECIRNFDGVDHGVLGFVEHRVDHGLGLLLCGDFHSCEAGSKQTAQEIVEQRCIRGHEMVQCHFFIV